jgi:tRNA 2-selenouridine synthase SelU
MNNLKYQNYLHYKLPITIDPLKFGKLLDQTNDKFIMLLTTKNVAVIKQCNKENFIRILKNGDLVLEFKDKFINENSFIRTIQDTSFTFENEKLISTQILSTAGNIFIYPLYEDTNAITLKNISPFKIDNIFN